MMKTSLFSFLILLCIFHKSSAQIISPQVLNATGNTSTTNTIEFSWSVGEMAVATLISNNIILTQGFLQPDISAHTTGIEDIILSNNITVFQNPVHNLLYIRQSEDIVETVSIYNALGQRIIAQKFINPELDMSRL